MPHDTQPTHTMGPSHADIASGSSPTSKPNYPYPSSSPWPNAAAATSTQRPGPHYPNSSNDSHGNDCTT